jgi:hypothetical protein
MVWAARHDYLEIVREAAPFLLDKPLKEMVQKLPPNIAIPWVRSHFPCSWHHLPSYYRICQVLYYESWREVFNKALFEPSWVTGGRAVHAMTFHDDRCPGQNVALVQFLCTSCTVNLDIIFSQFVRGLKNLKGLPNVDTLTDNIRCCAHHRPHIQAWQLSIKQQIQEIPTFDTFL